MSFDLTFFLATAAPKNADEFDEWLDADDDVEMIDPKNLSKTLKAWYDQVKVNYPPLNGPDAAYDDDLENPNVIDYYFSKDRIETGITYSTSQNAVEELLTAAGKHGIGVFDPQDGSVYFPDSSGGLEKKFEL
ncbi:MAG: hypothetical protein AAFY83_06305 [Pseudomonadota bacterium]